MNESLLSEPAGRADSNQPIRHSVYGLLLVIYAAIAAAAIVAARPLLSANDRSRWCTVWSLVERGTYQIDEIDSKRIKGKRRWATIDKVKHEGHFYSSKPPLLPTIVAGLYWVIKHTTGMNLLDHTEAVTRSILLLINWLPMMVALVLLVRLIERYVVDDWARLYLTAAAAFGTLLTPFLITFNNHTVAATSLVFALYPAVGILCEGQRRGRDFALVGFWAAFVCCNELPAALFGVAAFVLLWRVCPKKTLTWFIPAALVPLVAFFFTNYLVTGGLKPFYAYYGTEKYLYPGSYWLNPKGIDKGGDSPIVYFLHCTIGHHGIFSLSPIYLIALAAWLRRRETSASPLKIVIWLGGILTACVLGFYLTRTANYNYGGNTSGLRWTFWLIPFWLLSMIPILNGWSSRRWFRIAALVALAISVFSAFCPISNPWQQPWLFRLMEQAGWIHYG
ncbi:MAG: hypothetical protein GXP27_13015 [Planctomycetes bacterium]|nr:hypothetical protein [Planctomycetota bacterium]